MEGTGSLKQRGHGGGFTGFFLLSGAVEPLVGSWIWSLPKTPLVGREVRELRVPFAILARASRLRRPSHGGESSAWPGRPAEEAARNLLASSPAQPRGAPGVPSPRPRPRTHCLHRPGHEGAGRGQPCCQTSELGKVPAAPWAAVGGSGVLGLGAGPRGVPWEWGSVRWRWRCWVRVMPWDGVGVQGHEAHPGAPRVSGGPPGCPGGTGTRLGWFGGSKGPCGAPQDEQWWGSLG